MAFNTQEERIFMLKLLLEFMRGLHPAEQTCLMDVFEYIEL
jgi:hypothetical protein